MQHSMKLQVEQDINVVRNAYQFLQQHETEGDFEQLNLEVVLSNGLKGSFEMPQSVTAILLDALHALATAGELNIEAAGSDSGNRLNRMLTPNEAASMLQVSRPTIVRYIKCGHLEAVKVGTHYRIKYSDILQFQEEQKQSQKGQKDVLKKLAYFEQELDDM